MIYKSGKVVVVGCTSLLEVKKVAQKVGKLLTLIGVTYTISTFKVHNIVGAVDLKKKLAIESGVSNGISSFEPELFPGRIIELSNKVKATVFRNGKLHLTGAKSEEDLETAYIELYLDLKFK